MNERQTIWQNTLDQTYECKVLRLSNYQGELTIRDIRDGKIIHGPIDVGLSYGAIFGADVMDVNDWQEMCEKVISLRPSP